MLHRASPRKKVAVHAYLLALEGHVRSAGALVLFLPAILLLLTSFGLDGWRDGPIEPSLKLQAAIRKYWHHLLVISLFPTVFFVGCGYFKVAFEFVVSVFFASAIYGQWPILTKRVPYMFQFVLGAVWLGGASTSIPQFFVLSVSPAASVVPADWCRSFLAAVT